MLLHVQKGKIMHEIDKNKSCDQTRQLLNIWITNNTNKNLKRNY